MPPPGSAGAPPGTAGSVAQAMSQLRSSIMPGSRGSALSLKEPPPPEVGVRANEWTRQITETGKVYFFNRSTGASQWHIPNELYKSACLNPDPLRKHSKDPTIPPSEAHAMLGVDCMMEVPASEESKNMRDNIMGNFMAMGPRDSQMSNKPSEKPQLEIHRMLQVTVQSARGLRDADFMPGTDKSDPFCKCEIMGKPESAFRTHVVRDCLDPVWSHTQLVEDYEEGDCLEFTVFDEDDVSQNKNNNTSYMQESTSQLFMDGDEMLGRLVISDDDVIRDSHGEYPLEEAGDGIEAYLTVGFHVVLAFPGALGLESTDAMLELKRVRKDFDVRLHEVAMEPSEVVSFDPLHKQKGYTGDFMGIYEECSGRLTQGCTISVGSQTLTVDHVGPSDPKHQVKGAPVVYVHFTTPVKGVVKDKMKWHKVVKVPEKGFQENRIVLWYDGLTNEVVRIPHIG